MTTEALDQLGSRYELDSAQIEQLDRIVTLLAADQHAPSSVTEPMRATEVHLADSLVALELEGVRHAKKVADLGAGAGFPGLPLAVAMPGCDFALVESQVRKCAFIERVSREAAVGNARAVCVRAEQWPEGLAAHDLVIARALAPQAVVLEYAAPLLRLGGSLVDWRGRRDAEEEAAARVAAGQLGMTLERIVSVSPFADARDRHLHVYLKQEETPQRFPRRVGVARKRPLAG